MPIVSDEGHLKIFWLDHGRDPQCAPNPEYPNGIDVDLRQKKKGASCVATLNYPAPRCGVWLIACDRCHASFAVTAAGRVDDPKTVTLPCKLN
jgi:hypothetical protein